MTRGQARSRRGAGVRGLGGGGVHRAGRERTAGGP